jgi:predicted TIM-barrel fold metal-dependent hydrolase
MRLFIWLALALALIPPRPAGAADIRMIDAHSQVDSSVGMEQVLSVMDEAGIAHAILSSLHGDSRARDVVDAAKRHPGRITPSIGLKDGRYRAGEPAAIERVRKMAAGRAFGALSEVMVLHEAKGRDGKAAPEIVVAFDAPSVSTAVAIARERRWPLVVHIEFGFAYAQGQFDRYMQGLERLAAENRDLAVALTHMGQLNATNAERLIQAHPNLYFLTSHANTVWLGSRNSGTAAWINLFDGDVLAPAWQALIQRHPDRFVLAFDAVYDQDWSQSYVSQVRLWKAAFKTLPADVAHAVAHGNAERLWRLPAASAPQDPNTAATRRPSAAEALKNLDADGDGRLSSAEFRGPPRAFKLADTDGDGFLSAEELSAFRQRRRAQ